MIHIGTNLKAFRAARGLTQEQLAYDFGVSPQSISRWENGSTYPDILMLPVIASYFDVTIDALIGFSKKCTREERERIFDNMHDMDTQAQIVQYRKMLEKYPDDHHLQFGLAGVLFGVWNKTRNPETEREITGLCHKLLDVADAGIQCGAKRCLALMSKKNGDIETAMAYINELPSVLCGRELMALQVLHEMSFRDALRKFAEDY